MALQLGQAVSDGIGRILTRTGGILLAGLLAIQLVTQAAVNTAVIGYLPPEVAAQFGETAGLALPVSGEAGVALLAAAFLASSVYFVVLSRALARPARDLASFPSELLTRRTGRATLSMVVGGVVVSIAVTLGFAALFFPGIFLAASFLFFAFAVGVEDRGTVGALKRSWALARGDRLKLALLVVLSGGIGGTVGAVGSILDLAGLALASEVAVSVVTSVLFTALYGVIAAAYLQLRDESSGGSGGSVTADPIDASSTPEL
ncbi:hypothetical protein [Halorubrum cibi]|uniref:DUF7847 domain-containing protein n=1 Tax=Halorubrum cibi TaxID=413815 RepID=A0A521CZN7_9EURY|nr:hypothetical protein [Halorubrum cibi]SMO64915.1 hypothetical protein SAMN06264867_105232 [Halorubrum cibi]